METGPPHPAGPHRKGDEEKHLEGTVRELTQEAVPVGAGSPRSPPAPRGEVKANGNEWMERRAELSCQGGTEDSSDPLSCPLPPWAGEETYASR